MDDTKYKFMDIPITLSAQVFMYRGYGYCSYRSPAGSLNGYVIIKPGQKGYDFDSDGDLDFTDSTIRCHGGITEDRMVKDKRLIGFDTQHPGDFNIGQYEVAKDMIRDGQATPDSLSRFKRQHVWTLKDITKECHSIIDQLIKGDYKLAEI